MAVDAIQSNTNKERRASYLKAGATGALCGYALKHILPLTPLEKEEKYLYDTFNLTAADAKQKAIEAIINKEKLTPAQAEFAKLVNFIKITGSTIKAYDSPLKAEIIGLIKHVNDAGRNAKAITKRASVALTKDIRPTSSFVTLGAGIAIAGAFAYNVLQGISRK